MKTILKLSLLLVLLQGCASSNNNRPEAVNKYIKDSLEVLVPRCQNVLDAAYMAGELLGENDTIPGWEGYPVKLYEYYTGVDKYIGVPKKGLVYMLNPTPEKLAMWVINAVYDVTGEIRYDDVKKTLDFIKWQSGGQFPVKGVVYEAMYEEGFYEPYVFKDGVTVYLADPANKASDSTCSEEQLQFYLTMTNDDLKDYTGRYARISSTTREMYYAAGGQEEVGKSDDGFRSLEWLRVVADLYQQAWNSEKNFLIYAWANSNLVKEEEAAQ